MLFQNYCNFCGDNHNILKSYCINCKCCTWNNKCYKCKINKKDKIISNCELINNLININYKKYLKIQKSNKIYLIDEDDVLITISDYQKKLNEEYEMINNHLYLCNKKKYHNFKLILNYNKEVNNKDNTNLNNKRIFNCHIDKILEIIKLYN